MTKQAFISMVESYYGEYQNNQVKNAVLNYLSSYEEKSLNDLLELVLNNHFVRLGTPCIASIDKIHHYYQYGDYRNQVEGHTSLKKKNTVSATRPIEEEINPDDLISDEEAREIFAKIGKNKA